MMIVPCLAVTALTLLSTSAQASTRIAVLEFGKGGSVVSTNVRNPETSVNGVVSFWNALHKTGRRQLQYAGMSVVPGIFGSVDSGLVIGLGGRVDLDEMVNVASYLSEDATAAVGHLEVEGNRCADMMAKISDVQEIEDVSDFKSFAMKKVSTSGLSGIRATVASFNAAKIDQELANMFQEIERSARASGKTTVVHLVVDEDNAHSRRRLQARRRLEDEQDAEEDQNNNNQGENNNNNNNEQNNNNAEDDNIQNQQNQYSGYYGYGYYNAYGEWITPYKTMFQIQYFNVVLWTAVALVVALVYTIYLMINMPMEADTLLFGESAKMVGDD
ncbi:hypothetical protein MPSEU_000564000 [Mayamaea pseudoterrestris]|nr:hypothetical protein MPSEU_000564000 [Mayamaea pseudoterrestris]